MMANHDEQALCGVRQRLPRRRTAGAVEKISRPEFRTLGKHALWREEGERGSYLKINGKIFRDTMNSNLPRHAIWRPGMTWDKVGELDPTRRHPMTAGASNPQARLRDMDAMGIDQAFLYPTWFAEGFHLVEDPDVAYALARAYNDWIADFCGAAPGAAVCRRDDAAAEHGLHLEELRRVAQIPCFPRRIHPADVHRGPLLHPSLLRSAVGRTGAPRTDRRGASDGRFMEPGMDLARAVRREGEEPADSALVAGADRRRPAAGGGGMHSQLFPHPRRWGIRLRRSCPTGWTTTCSSPPR